MDPRMNSRRGYDMDLTVLRSLFALDPNTNIPISTNWLMTADGIGGVQWKGLASYMSTVSISNISMFDTTLTNDPYRHNITITNGALFVDGAPVTGSGLNIVQLASSLQGLGTYGYVSTLSLYSTVRGLGTAGYVSSGTLTSTVVGLGTAGYISTASFYSTVVGLGTAGYVSTAQYNSFSNLIYNNISYISSGNLYSTTTNLLGYIDDIINSQGNGSISSFTVNGTANFYSTLSVGTFFYINGNISTLSTSIGDTIVNLGTTPGYLSSLNSRSLSTGMIGLSSINFMDTVTGVKQLVAVTNGVFQVNGASITGDVTTGNLTSTVIGLGTTGYLSTVVFTGVVSTANLVGLISSANLNGIVSSANLVGLVSSANLVGLISSGNLAGLVSTPNLEGLVSSPNLIRFISTANLANLVSTPNLAGHVSTPNLIDLVSTANLRDFISTPYFDSQTTSSLRGLGTLGYLSSFQAHELSTGLLQVSSIRFMDSTTTAPNAGTFSLLNVSSGQLLFNGGYTGSGGGGGGVTQLVAGTGIILDPPVGTGAVNVSVNSSSLVDSPLTSTLNGLGTAGYISSSQLQSSVVALKQSFFVVNANTIYLQGTGNSLTVSSLASIVYLSSFLQSTVTYRGSNGTIAPQWTVGTQAISFTTANLQLDSFSTLITSNAIVNIEVLGNFMFSPLALPQTPVPIYMSSFVRSGVTGNANYLSSQMFQTMFFPTNYNSGIAGGLYGNISNYFAPKIKMSIPGSVVQNFYPNAPLVLGHYLPNAVTLTTTQGFLNSNTTVFFGSTNSVFISVQNMP
jgi:hypothetical protein